MIRKPKNDSHFPDTRYPAGPLTHWLSNTFEPMSLDVSRYSGFTRLLVKQALDDEQDRIGWDKVFRGFLGLTWGLLEAPHEIANPYYIKQLNPTRG